MCSHLSLFAHCITCGSKCCRDSQGIGSPIISQAEADKIGDLAVYLEKHLETGEIYYTVGDNNGQCCLLENNGKCLVQGQGMKPLDDLCYPIKAIYDESGQIIFVVDTFCPAHDKLTPEFVTEAKKVAMESIQRFSRATYEHWLKNHIGWITKTAKVI